MHPRSPPAVERLEPIGLEALDLTAGLRRRFDVKYLVPHAALGELIDRLARDHRVLDLDGVRHFGYRTTYFDTEQRSALRDHLQGRRRRLKVRVRHYLDSGACFFELKLRGARGCTIKHRRRHDPDSQRSLTLGSLTALEAWVQAAYAQPAPAPLAPALEVSYRRTTLVAPEHGQRLTIDLDLRMSPVGAGSRGRLDPQLAVVETKAAHGHPVAARALTAVGARPVGNLSKYCLGAVLTSGQPGGNALLPVLRHCTTRSELGHRIPALAGAWAAGDLG